MPAKPRGACENCASPLTMNHDPRGRFCSNACQQEKQFKDYISKWKAGREVGGTAHGFVSDYVRRYLKAIRGEKCEVCGWAERHPVTGLIPLVFDHADGDSSNHAEENIRILCPNDHSLTPTYQALNKGRGRAWRRRYGQ